MASAFFKYISFIWIVIGAGITLSCVDDDVEPAKADQLFRPILFQANINGGDVEFTWVPIKNAKYLLEMSRDSGLFQRELQTVEMEGRSKYIVTDLWSLERYSARVKAISLEPGIKDSEFQIITFRTGQENIFYTPESVSIDRILLKWNFLKDVTDIKVFKGGDLVDTITLSAVEKGAGARLVTGLAQGQEYTFRIYKGEMLRGTVTATTTQGT